MKRPRLPSRPLPFLASLLVPLLLATGCGPRPASAPADGYPGYAEADAVPFASTAAGRIARIYVQRGERVAAGAPLFALDGQAPRTAAVEVEVAELLAHEGDTVSPAQPVLALLAPHQLRARFFVEREQAAALAPGRQAMLACEGCGDGLPATVSFVARRPEPGRLDRVFLVEARPDAEAPGLRAGEPLRVRLAQAGPR